MIDLRSVRPGFSYRLFLSWLERASNGQSSLALPDRLSPAGLAALRRMTGVPSFPQALSSLQIRRWTTIAVPGGAGPRPARLYRPFGKPTGVVLFLHGGGFVHCDLVSHHGICCRLARQSRAMILSLDYRLAPENPFPAGIEDGWATLCWLSEVTRKMSLPLAVCGDSAGGNIAAVLARRARDHGDMPLAGQLLYYPTLTGLWSPQTRQDYAEGYMLTNRLLDWYGRQYIPDDTVLFDPDLAPVFARSLHDLAPAMIVTAGFDPLRGEGEIYGALLRQSGVGVDMRCFSSAIHGFLNGYAVLVDGRKALRTGGVWLRRRFEAAQP